jgi:hypothetical protein
MLRLVLAALLISSSGAAARSLEVGPGKPYALPSAAIAAARPGDSVLIAPGNYTDCAVVTADRLLIAGTGTTSAAEITGKTCEDKGILVVHGNNVTIRNLVLSHARSSENNGAGIRAEGGTLTVEHISFVDDQNGILTAPSPGGVITVRDSLFNHNGTCISACAHGIYAGAVKLLRVERSLFADTQQGHHIKSRALRTEVLNCAIGDGAAGTASFALDVPNGGAVLVQGTRIEKGPKAENHEGVITIGEEGATNPTPEITVTGNTVHNDGAPTTFVDNRTTTPAMLSGNVLTGLITPLKGPGEVR